MTRTAPELEDQAAFALLETARMLLQLQAHTQPDGSPELRAALSNAAEIRAEAVLGPFPHVRIVTVGADGEDLVLLRRFDFAQRPPVN